MQVLKQPGNKAFLCLELSKMPRSRTPAYFVTANTKKKNNVRLIDNIMLCC